MKPNTRAWCVLARIHFKGTNTPCVVLSIHLTEEEAKELADDLHKNPFWFIETQYMEYTHEVTEGQYFHNYKIDAVLDRRN